ncbi:TPA: 7TM diverse intracellular signaling domain-containing protein [Elizabethkingia anophelis]|nr:hypothetical protein [Elizabethkingia anophelis]
MPFRKLYIRIFLLTVVICCSVRLLANSTDTLKLSGANSINIIPYLRYYKDCNKLSEKAIWNKDLKGVFQQHKDEHVINNGFTTCSYWYTLTISNVSDREELYYWNFYNDGIFFTLYETDGSNRLKIIGNLNNKLSLSKRQIPIRSLTFLINFKSGETKHFLLKTQAIGHVNLYFPTDISTEKDILTYEVDFAFLMGRYYGFFLFSALFNLLLFIIIRRRLYGYMFGYTSFLLMFALTEYLYDPYFYPEHLYTLISIYPKMFYILCALFFYTKIFQKFTNHNNFLPRWNHILNYSNSFLLVIAVIFFILKIVLRPDNDFSSSFYIIISAIIAIHLILLFTNIFYSAWKRNKYTCYYLLCNIIFITAIIIYILNTLDLTSVKVVLQPGYMIIGMAFELITLSIIFIIKYRNDFIGLNRKLQKEKEQQAFLASELIKSQETERQAIADNLHDGLGNTLNALKLTLTSTGNFENDNIQKIFSLANQQFRELIYQIAPKEIGEYGLYRATEQSLNVFKASRIQFSINFMGNENLLSEGLKINIYRIFQELINNIIRHSDASFVEITIDTNEKEFILQIEDNGNGVAQDMREGMGIKSIKNRTAYYNGTYHQENLNPGMISIIQIPLNNENNKNYYSG